MHKTPRGKIAPIAFDAALAKFMETDGVEWGEACRKIECCILNRRSDLAHAALNVFIQGLSNPIEVYSHDLHVSQLFDIRHANALDAAGYTTAGSVDMADDADLLNVQQIGKEAIETIRRRLEQAKAAQPLQRDYFMIDQELQSNLERKHMTQVQQTNDQLSQLIDMLSGSNATAIAEIDVRIANFEAQIEKLRTARKLLAGSSGRTNRPLKIDDGKQKIINAMFEIIQKDGPMTPSDLVLKLKQKGHKIHYMIAAKLAKASESLVKNGKLIDIRR